MSLRGSVLHRIFVFMSYRPSLQIARFRERLLHMLILAGAQRIDICNVRHKANIGELDTR